MLFFFMNMYYTAVININDLIKEFMLKHFFLLLMFLLECNAETFLFN